MRESPWVSKLLIHIFNRALYFFLQTLFLQGDTLHNSQISLVLKTQMQFLLKSTANL